MIEGLSVLGLIPARGGSKGVPRKNIRLVAGRPLLAWTIDAARASRYLDRLVLSTDDCEIGAVAIAAGCEVPFLRPPELARDDTPGIDPVLHALGQLPPFDIVVLLQPTSPLRLASDIDGCIERMLAARAPASFPFAAQPTIHTGPTAATRAACWCRIRPIPRARSIGAKTCRPHSWRTAPSMWPA